LNYSRSKSFLLLATIPMLSACNLQNDESEKITELAKKFDEMQQEQRLVLKEVISLQKKMDALVSAKRLPDGSSPALERSIVLPDANRLLGSENAEYAMIEFMDYQCPYCIRYAKQSLPTIKKRYVDTGKLKYGIRDFPLSFHSKAEGAAIAANCAGKQSKYWLMHDELVANSKSLNDELYTTLATKLNLDSESYSTCLNNPEMKKAVESDFAYGTEIGIRGTPNFYIGKIEGESIVNVIHISGARSVEAFDRAIQQAMTAN
jgi:protein-disulfide isomerase